MAKCPRWCHCDKFGKQNRAFGVIVRASWPDTFTHRTSPIGRIYSSLEAKSPCDKLHVIKEEHISKLQTINLVNKVVTKFFCKKKEERKKFETTCFIFYNDKDVRSLFFFFFSSKRQWEYKDFFFFLGVLVLKRVLVFSESTCRFTLNSLNQLLSSCLLGFYGQAYETVAE